MVKLGRYSLSEISLGRLISGINTRVADIPNSLSWNFGSQASANREKLSKLKNLHLGKRCFIVANGPSLARMDLDLLQAEITFGLNRIYLMFEKTRFRPTYYIAVNELVLEQFAPDIKKLAMAKFINWNCRSLFNSMDPSIHFIKSRLVIRDFFGTDPRKPLVVGGTVTYVALQLAFFMGFQQVYLIGLDHHYVDKGIPNKTVIQNHSQDESHFHPEYFPKGIKWQLPDLLRSELDYQIALNYYEKHGREILDATEEGRCQIFPKVDYSSLFIKKGG